MMVLKLMHGRHRPDEQTDDWGSSGPYLQIEWLHATLFTTFCLGIKDKEGTEIEFFLDDWEHKKQDGVLVEGLLHYDGVFYGDWEVFEIANDSLLVEAFEISSAKFPKNRDWQDIPKREGVEYD